MDSIDWNKMSEFGLIRRINEEILHPLGLALSRDTESGYSKEILVSAEPWEYDTPPAVPAMSDDEIKDAVRKIVRNK